jgi:hypothetical protein
VSIVQKQNDGAQEVVSSGTGILFREMDLPFSEKLCVVEDKQCNKHPEQHLPDITPAQGFLGDERKLKQLERFLAREINLHSGASFPWTVC